MVFLKTANAKVIHGHENLTWHDWQNISGIDSFKNRTAAKIIKNYNPDDYLLTHCTIIASVNVDGKVNHYITPDTAKFVNNNGDSWESKLLSTPEVYRSFIAAYNFVEHVQRPELAKGRIISAALRQIPVTNKSSEKIYLVDILVATDRKHKDLINKISSGQLNTLSMGCHVAYTICSKCGHKASEEDQLCEHIKYAKGTYFYDEFGQKRIIAELCGHRDDPKSVRFIEASWVAIPAFPGAVMRNILSFDETEYGIKAKEKCATLIESAHLKDPFEGISNYQKAASLKLSTRQIISELYKLSFFIQKVGY